MVRKKTNSAKTSIIASTSSRSTCLPCANAARTSPYWPNTFSRNALKKKTPAAGIHQGCAGTHLALSMARKRPRDGEHHRTGVHLVERLTGHHAARTSPNILRTDTPSLGMTRTAGRMSLKKAVMEFEREIILDVLKREPHTSKRMRPPCWGISRPHVEISHGYIGNQRGLIPEGTFRAGTASGMTQSGTTVPGIGLISSRLTPHGKYLVA